MRKKRKILSKEERDRSRVGKLFLFKGLVDQLVYVQKPLTKRSSLYSVCCFIPSYKSIKIVDGVCCIKTDECEVSKEEALSFISKSLIEVGINNGTIPENLSNFNELIFPMESISK